MGTDKLSCFFPSLSRRALDENTASIDDLFDDFRLMRNLCFTRAWVNLATDRTYNAMLTVFGITSCSFTKDDWTKHDRLYDREITVVIRITVSQLVNSRVHSQPLEMALTSHSHALDRAQTSATTTPSSDLIYTRRHILMNSSVNSTVCFLHTTRYIIDILKVLHLFFS